MASRHLSIRISEQTYEQLEAQSRRERESVSELARRLIDEGLRMQAHPGIVFRDTASGRQAALADGPKVWVVARVLRELTDPFETAIAKTAELTGLTPHQVMAAAQYYAAYRQEIDEWLREQDEEAERAYATWKRELELLGV